MKVNLEARRISAQVFPSLAIALLIAGVIGPAFTGAARPVIIVIATILSLVLYALALGLVGRLGNARND